MSAVQAGDAALAEELIRQWKPDPRMPGWWNEYRQAAVEAYQSLQLPEKTDERWHYGEARRFALEGLQLASSAKASGERYERICRLTQQPGRIACLGMVGQQLHQISGGTSLDAAGVSVRLLSAELQSRGDLVQDLLPARAAAFVDRLAAAHYAMLDSGFLVDIPKNCKAPEDIHLILPSPGSGMVTSSHVIVNAAEHSEASVYLHIIGENDARRDLMMLGVTVHAAAGAQLQLTTMQHLGARSDVWLHEEANLGRESSISVLAAELGAANVRHELAVNLGAPGASAKLRGAYFGRSRQRIDFYTQQNHNAPHTTSDLLFKGALADRARAVYQGLITVDESAQRTDAYQSNRVLVLSQQARADSSPQLEIKANDVRCTHGSTVSNVGERELFYLNSRGISTAEARRLLVSGFISEVADGIAFEPLRDYIYDYLMERTQSQ